MKRNKSKGYTAGQQAAPEIVEKLRTIKPVEDRNLRRSLAIYADSLIGWACKYRALCPPQRLEYRRAIRDAVRRTMKMRLDI